MPPLVFFRACCVYGEPCFCYQNSGNIIDMCVSAECVRFGGAQPLVHHL